MGFWVCKDQLIPGFSTCKETPGPLFIRPFLSSTIIWCVNSNINTYLTRLMPEPWDNTRKSNEMIIIIITSRNNLHGLMKGKESLQEVRNRTGCIREPKAGLCDNLEGWDVERGGRGSRRRAHMYTCD